jgi:hypothetical protein
MLFFAFWPSGVSTGISAAMRLPSGGETQKYAKSLMSEDTLRLRWDFQSNVIVSNWLSQRRGGFVG